MIYVVTTIFLFLVEMICWGVRASNLYQRSWVRWICNHIPQDPVLMLLHRSRRTLNRANTGKLTKAGRTQIRRMLEWWEHLEWTDHVDVLLRIIEIGNLVW